ncbi:N-acetylmuramoyl-L-alanine amidase [Zooshikella marina]|uniref:N-acetylmuramoyl-L-alanine amidase n=1 Tax=Zooshikella ganghwensis TaxID=202772 RepID=UPI001BAF0E91|nr:N-acetylmuramoyl-L-alanine amidase [Zooshikella ganghwensis]MBU2708892.1 N-acetylmuramoyl-L-alanine amidase [Zooshikella ganghwensis]
MNIEYLVVHCSDSPNSKNYSAKDIHQWHLQRKWAGIGYHKVIKRDGSIENGRPEYWVGAHVKGYNSRSLGVCLIGRDSFTKKQFETLEIVLTDWKCKYPNATVCGHKDLNPQKTCPNFNVTAWWHNKEII